MPFLGTPRPQQRWRHASTHLHDFAIVSYRVEPARLVRMLPPGFEVELFRCDDGADYGLISAVPFLDRAFHWRWLPFVRIECGQVNYRAYVRFQGAIGVWFFGTSLDSWLVAWPRWRWQMPWFRDRIRVDSVWDGDALRSWSLAVDGAWGGARCALASGAPFDRIDGFRDRDHVLEALCHPLVGWYPRRDRGIGRYSVWHEPLAPLACTIEHAQFDVFERLDLVTRGTQPHSALVQRAIRFDVHTPPARVVHELAATA